MPLFGQILAALYQEDIVEEDDIRQWHSLPASKGQGLDADEAEKMKRCWTIGTCMIQQFDEQGSDDDDDTEESDDEEEEDEDEDEDEDEE